MANYVLAAFLIVFGLTTLLSVAIPMWVIGLLALAAGILLLIGK